MGWRPTAALTRAVIVGLVALGGALALGSPVLVVLGLPFVLLAAVGLLHRPVTAPSVSLQVERDSLREGQSMPVRVEVAGHGIEHVTHAVTRPLYASVRPASGVTSGLIGAHAEAVVGLRRWGPAVVGDGVVALTSAWGAFRWGPDGLDGKRVLVLPSPAVYDARAAVPRPVGLVGAHRSVRVGDGTEYAGTRSFQAGDRLRRINWRVSQRAQGLYTDTTHTEDDTGVLLVVDAQAEYGPPGRSSLDLGVRAAAAIAEQHVRQGDRIALRVVGGQGQVLAPGGGRRHLRRLLGVLARTVPGRPSGRDADALKVGARSGDVVIWLTPLLSSALAASVASLAARGLTVLVVDTLPSDVPFSGELESLAWRLRLLERADVVDALTAAGVAVVPWRGPGTLDEVLRRLARQPPRARPR